MLTFSDIIMYFYAYMVLVCSHENVKILRYFLLALIIIVPDLENKEIIDWMNRGRQKAV